MMAVLIVPIVFGIFPLVHSMASNADSLVLFDLAHDVLSGKVLRYWNLPRAPYLFPDTLIALWVMSIGWFGQYSIWAVATINYLLLVWVAHQCCKRSASLKQASLIQIALSLSVALILIGLCFPFAMVNIYWQLFASGAHFVTVIMALAILLLLQSWYERPRIVLLLLIFALVFLEALSDSMATLLLMIWVANQCLWRYMMPKSIAIPTGDWVGKKSGMDLWLTVLAMVLGTLLGAQLPRQSLLESFFSLDKFIGAATLFGQWVIASPRHILFLLFMVLGSWMYAIVFEPDGPSDRDTFPTKVNANTHRNLNRNGLICSLRSFALWPSLGIMVITPLFYQELGSLRYLAFPALLFWMLVAAFLMRLFQAIRHIRFVVQLAIAIGALGFFGAVTNWDLRHELIGAAQVTSGRDAVGLSVGADASGALTCVTQAAKQYPLEDGVATYWNARPTRFASHFQYYLAQINPWRPRAGYFLWGNNGIDFVYRKANTNAIANANANANAAANIDSNTYRRYNFVLATKPELAARLWGSLPLQASQTIECNAHTIFYFENPAILWQYLFPLGLNADLASLGAITSTKSNGSEGHAQNVHTYLGDDLSTQTGVRDGSAIVTTGKAGFLVYGPYISLPAGFYRLTVLGKLEHADVAVQDGIKDNIGMIDVSADFGKKIIASAPLSVSAKPSLVITQIDFSLERATADIEFRMQLSSEVVGRVEAYRLESIAN